MFRNHAFRLQTGNTPQSVTETATMQNPRRNTFSSKRLRNLAASVATLGLAAILSGCAGNMPSNFGTQTPVTITLAATGKVFGGQQPVSGSTVQLYTVGTTGLKSASTPLLTSTVTSDANGNFSITGKYACTGATQVYITASGGNPSSGITNNNLTMAAALGSCATLLANAATTFITINEVTTVAAAYALAPFASSMTSVGASGSNPTGLVNAFANAALLANTSTGTAGGAGLAAGVTVPTTEINTLADIIAACVNTAGSGSTQCNTLFSATGASDTFGAALAISKNPGAAAITALTSLATATPPFQPSFSTAPSDYTVAVSYTAGGVLATPYGVAIDAGGNAWVTNEGGSAVTELSPTGAALASPTATGLYGAQGVAVDTSGNVWVANTAGNSVVKFTLTAGLVSGTASFTAGGISAPSAIVLSNANNAYVANFNGNSVTELNSSGAAINGSPLTGSGNITSPTGITLGKTGSGGTVYVTTGSGGVVSLNSTGAYVSTLTDNALQGPSAIATDPVNGYILASGFTTGTAISGALSEFAPSTPSSVSPATSGLSNPAGVASDGTSIWVANSNTSGGLAQLTYGAASSVSPAAGYGSLNTPVGVAVDSSGSIWTANSGSNTVAKFVGLAAPVTTPLSLNVGP